MRRSSMKFKFLLKITLTLVAVFSAMVMLTYWLFSAELKEAVLAKGEALAFPVREKALKTIEMSAGDTSGLEALSVDLQAIIGAKYSVKHARILKADGSVIASNLLTEVNRQVAVPPGMATGGAAVLVSQDGELNVFTPLTGSDLSIEIGFDNDRFAQKALRTGLIVLVFAIGSLIFIYILVNHWVNENIEAPLESLSRNAKTVSSGDLRVDFGAENSDVEELAHIYQAFSGMTEGVRAIVSQIGEVTNSVYAQTQHLSEENTALTSAIVQQNEMLKTSTHSVESIDRNTGEINGRVEELFLISQETSSSILQIGGSIEEVEQHVSKLSLAVGETSSSITEIGRSIGEVANRSQELAQNADEMSRAIGDISATIIAVERNAQLSNDLSKEVSTSAREGLESVEKSGEGMGRIKVSVQETNEVIQALGRRSQEIGEIITVINQVTEKTNLLALNAAIIAAAAGEHGASFAVVADGIRDLARQVAAKTREIESLVQGVQKETRKAIEKVNAGLTSVTEGEVLSSAASEKLRAIYETSLRSEDMSKLITSAMAEQNRNSRALADASSRVSNISHQIAMATQQEATASNQIQRSVSQMEELAKSVLRTTHEQSEGSRRISEATSRITSAIQAISEITSKHKAESESVLHTIHGNQELLGENERRLDTLRSHIDSVNGAVAELQQVVGRFKLA